MRDHRRLYGVRYLASSLGSSLNEVENCQTNNGFLLACDELVVPIFDPELGCKLNGNPIITQNWSEKSS